MSDAPVAGSIIVYPYLWIEQKNEGETEGRKSRPVCLVLRIPDAARKVTHLFLLAISSKPPRPAQVAIEIPDTERRRAGLSRYPQAWITVSEFNYDVAERSWYLEPQSKPIGAFSATFLREVATALRAQMSKKSASKVDRTI